MTNYLSLLPLCLLLTYFLVGLVTYVILQRHGRGHCDKEVLARHASPLLGRGARHFMMWILGPYERGLVRLGVSPQWITAASVVMALLAGVALARGSFALGGWLYLLAGILDILDGRVARASGCSSTAGAYFDSVADRYAELFVFIGLAVYYRDSWRLWLPLGAALGSLMVSYARARGEALGVDVRIGTMQRPERLFYLGVTIAYSPLWETLTRPGGEHPEYLPTVVMLAFLGVSSHITALHRIVHTFRQLRINEAAARDASDRSGVGTGTQGVAARLWSRLRPIG
jgi:phosphatidylglycerophosphate synthase